MSCCSSSFSLQIAIFISSHSGSIIALLCLGYMLGMGWDLARSDLSRTWRYPHKAFCSVYIRVAPLIVKNCDLDSNTHAIFFLNDNDSAMSIATVSHRECQWSMRNTLCSCPCVNAVIHWYGRQQNTRCSCSTDTRHVKQVLKTFKSAFMLLLVQKEQHKHSFQSHIIISVLQYSDVPNVRQPKIATTKSSFGVRHD